LPGFESDQNNVQVLRKRLESERSIVVKAEQARVEAEARCFIAERERDMYKVIVQRMQDRLSVMMRDPRIHGSGHSHMEILNGILHGSNAALYSDLEEPEEDSVMHDEDEDDHDEDVEMMEEEESVADTVTFEQELEDPFNELAPVPGEIVSDDIHRQPRTISISNDDI
jgi:hypothetical protein